MSKKKSPSLSTGNKIIVGVTTIILLGAGILAITKIPFGSGNGGGGGDTPIIDNNGTPTAIIINETPIVF